MILNKEKVAILDAGWAAGQTGRLLCHLLWKDVVCPSRSRCLRLESQCVIVELTDTYATPSSGRTRLVLRVAPQGRCYAHTLSLTHTPTQSLCFLPVRFASLSLTMNWRNPQGSEQMQAWWTGALKTMNLTSVFEPTCTLRSSPASASRTRGSKACAPCSALLTF